MYITRKQRYCDTTPLTIQLVSLWHKAVRVHSRFPTLSWQVCGNVVMCVF